MKIKADPLLFKAWTKLALDIRAFSSIVQNDMDVPLAAVNSWEKDAMAALITFEKLIQDTKRYVLKGSPSEAVQTQTTTSLPSDDYLFPDQEPR